LGQLFNELKRRNVFRVAVAYLVAAWLVLQVAQLVLEAIEAPSWVIQVFLLVFALGLPLVLLFSWAYELTPEGLKREKDVDRSRSVTHQTGQKLNQITIGMVIALVVFIAADRTLFSDRTAPAPMPEVSETVVGDKSVAVLAFDDLSPEGDQEYFADGLSEELLNVLAQVPDLKVAGRTSSFAFKGKDADLREIGEVLNVAHILEGSVRKSGNRIRVTAQLINAADGFHLYSETFDRNLTDVFEVQDEIAAKISAALQSELIGTESVHELEPTKIEAYDLFLVARQKIHTRNKEEMEEASRLLDRALEIDPDYAPALVQKALALYLLSDESGSYGDIPIAEVLAIAQPMVRRALALDERNAEAHALTGLMMESDPIANVDQQIEVLEHALELNPNLDDTRNWLASAYFRAGRGDESIALYETIIERDPLYGPALNNLIQGYAFGFEFDKADALIGRVERITGETDDTNQAWGTLAFVKGELATAIRHFRRAYENNPNASVTRLLYGVTWLRLGEYEQVVEVGLPFFRVVAMTALGRYEEAEELLGQMSPVIPFEGVVSAATDFYVRTGRYDDLVDYINRHFGDLDGLLEHFDQPSGREVGFAGQLAYAYLQLDDEAAYNKVVAFLQRAIERQRANTRVEQFSQMFDQANLDVITGDYDAAHEDLVKLIDRGMSTVSIFENPAYAPLLEQERFRELDDIMTDRINAERAKLGLDPYRPAVAMH
jgi:TolB-like protein